MKMVFLMLISLFMGCSVEPASNAAEIERANTFAKFQGYVDQTEPSWKVVAVRHDEETTGEDGERHLYYVVLAKDGKQRVVALVVADFKLPDGSTESRIYRPAKIPADKPFDEGPIEHPEPW